MQEDLDYGFIIDQMTWSFSRITSFEQCPYEWKCHYIDLLPGEQSFFGQFGSFMHKILELYEKEALSIFDLSGYYKELFDEEVTLPAPANQYVDIRQSYYQKGLDYLDNIDLILDGYDVLGVEKEVRFKVGTYDMIGYIDLLLRDIQTGEITILDHKSASLKFKKNGSLSKTSLPHFEEFKKQLYLYSIPVINEYGKVNYLEWNMFKDQQHIKIDWIEDEYQVTKDWAVAEIEKILQTKEFLARPDSYYCWNLCSQRHSGCPFKPESKRDRGIIDTFGERTSLGGEWV